MSGTKATKEDREEVYLVDAEIEKQEEAVSISETNGAQRTSLQAMFASLDVSPEIAAIILVYFVQVMNVH
jgi:hypothetical protein